MIAQKILFRLIQSTTTLPDRTAWSWAIGLLLLYGLIFLPIGFWGQFLTLQIETSLWTIAAVTVRALIMPGISEELFFRAILIPHPSESVSRGGRMRWIGISSIAFVLYHPFNFFAPAFFSDPIFLIGAGLLGIVCTISYLQSGSIWTAVVIHWIVVVVWLLGLGGLAKF